VDVVIIEPVDMSDNEEVGQNLRKTCAFKSMPNFRRLVPPTRDSGGGSADRESVAQRPLNLFRASRPDCLTAEEVDAFIQLNIRTIVDLRSESEYRRADGPKLLQVLYPTCAVKLTSFIYNFRHSFEQRSQGSSVEVHVNT